MIPLLASLVLSDAAEIRAATVVRESVAAYRRLSSYFDRGSVTEYTTSGGRREAAWPRTEFSTWYTRPGKIRLQAREVDRGRPQSSWVLWPAGSEYRLWSSLAGVQTCTVSSVPSRVSDFVETVLSQVDPRLAGVDPLLPLVQGRYVGSSQVDGATCDVVRGETDRMADVTLWIDQRTRLIRQIRMPRGDRSEIVVCLRPLPNPQFAPGTFAFKPPKP